MADNYTLGVMRIARAILAEVHSADPRRALPGLTVEEVKREG